MKRLILIFLITLLTSCSFDNKTGIWKDATIIDADNDISNKIEYENDNNDYVQVFTDNQIYNEEKLISNNYEVVIDEQVKNVNWPQINATNFNNVANFMYTNQKNLISKSKKLNKNKSPAIYNPKDIIFYEDKIISHDHKGTIFVYSTISKKDILKYNFYKKKFKNYEKKIYMLVNNNKLYAADNLGYVYVLDLEKQTVIWATNFGVPFRSNIKLVDESIYLANEDNVIYSIDINTGKKKWQFGTTSTFLKSSFKNNLAIDQVSENVFLLNTSGELYSINYISRKINWVLNFKSSSMMKDADLFFGKPIIIKNNDIVISTKDSMHSYNYKTGKKNWILPLAPVLKPIATQQNTFVFTKNNLLICIDSKSGKIVWSKYIYNEIPNKKLKKLGKLVNLVIAGNHIKIFSQNGYLLSFNYADGSLDDYSLISKSGISSEVIFANGNMLIVNNKNQLLKFN